nr:recombinase family protein [Streptomyces sp. NBC_00857]
MSDTDRPLAFIYDRHATERSRGMLDLRLEGCRNWAALQRWDVAGAWVDLGDHALTDDHRPQFDVLCTAMTLHAAERTAICLIHNWERLTRNNRATYQRRVAAAGGYTATAFGENDQTAVATMSRASASKEDR